MGTLEFLNVLFHCPGEATTVGGRWRESDPAAEHRRSSKQISGHPYLLAGEPVSLWARLPWAGRLKAHTAHKKAYVWKKKTHLHPKG